MVLLVGLVHGNGWFLVFWLSLWGLRGSTCTFHNGLELSFDFVLDLFHELDVLFGLNSFILLVEDLYFLNFVLVEFDFGLEMGIFLSELFHIFNDFFDFDSVLFGGDLVVDFLDLPLDVLDFLADLFEIALLDLQFFLKL